jgi:hypothetical protein
MNLRHLVIALAALGAAALAACGGSPTLAIQPAAATSPAPIAADGPAPTPATSGPALQPGSMRCDAGPWTGAISPEGRPDNFDAGDAGAVYVWHDGDGWHIRTTDKRAVDHHYTGTIRVEPGVARFTDIHTVRDERDDRVTIDGDNVLHYDFHTFASIDGVDFHVSCPPQQRVTHERLAFHTEFDGHPIADRVKIGHDKQSPKTADFAFTRKV